MSGKLNPSYKHGAVGTSEYKSWCQMKRRCYDKNAVRYAQYGGRGIGICSRWMDFKNFLADMGKKPTPNHTIERKDTNGNYAPDNCKWATQKEQQNNRNNNHLVLFHGERITLARFSELAGISIKLAWYRLAAGWSAEDAFSTPVRKYKTV